MSDYDNFDELIVRLSELRSAVELGDPLKIALVHGSCNEAYNDLILEIKGLHREEFDDE